MDRIKLLKKGSLAAIGLASLTSKKANSLLEDLIRKGKLSQKEGEVVAKKMISHALKEEQRIRKNVLGEFAKSAKKVMEVTQSEDKKLMKQTKGSTPKAAPKKKPKKMKGNGMSIKAKLIIFSVALSVIPILVVGGFSATRFRGTIQEKVGTLTQQLA